MIHYNRHDRFNSQLKKLIKKYNTLEDDIVIAEKASIELLHLHKLDNRSVELVPRFDRETVKIYKIKKFACKSLFGKGVRSGIRIVYAFFPAKMKVTYLEIYYKEKSNTDMDYDFAKSYIIEVENSLL